MSIDKLNKDLELCDRLLKNTSTRSTIDLLQRTRDQIMDEMEALKECDEIDEVDDNMPNEDWIEFFNY